MSFEGFASGGQVTPLPAALLRDLAPRMDDPAELLVTLYAAEAITRLRRFPRMLARADLEDSRPLIDALASMCPRRDVSEAFTDGLEAAVERGSLLSGRSQRDGAWVEWLALNDADGRRAMSQAAAMPVPRAARGRTPMAFSAAAIWHDAFGTLPPAILSDELASAESRYGIEWLRDAFREAAANNARSWRYVTAILERWESEGRDRAPAGARNETEDVDGRADADQLGASRAQSRFGHLYRG